MLACRRASLVFCSAFLNESIMFPDGRWWHVRCLTTVGVSPGACVKTEPLVVPCTAAHPVILSGRLDNTVPYVWLDRFPIFFSLLHYPIFVGCRVSHQPFLPPPPVVFRWGILFSPLGFPRFCLTMFGTLAGRWTVKARCLMTALIWSK